MIYQLALNCLRQYAPRTAVVLENNRHTGLVKQHVFALTVRNKELTHAPSPHKFLHPIYLKSS